MRVGPLQPAKPRLPHKLGRAQLTSSVIPAPCKPLLRPMARRGPFSRYAALLTLLLVAGAAGRALRQDEEASPSPEWEESPAEEEWAESPPPAESPEPESSPEGSDYSSPDPYPFVVAVMKGDAAFCSGALIAPLVSVAAVWYGRPHAAAISRRMHHLSPPGPTVPPLISSIDPALLCQVVLTSAHCVVGSNNQTEEVWARLGWPDLKSRWVGGWGRLQVSMRCWMAGRPTQLQRVACPCVLAWLCPLEGNEQQLLGVLLQLGLRYIAWRPGGPCRHLAPSLPDPAAAALRWMELRSGVWRKSLSTPLGEEALCWFSRPAALP